MGWLSACAADPRAAGVVAAEIGRAGIGVPLLSAALAVDLLRAAGSDAATAGAAQVATHGSAAAADLVAAIEETGAVAAVVTGLTATRRADGWVLTAPATVVEWAAEAEFLVGLAKVAGTTETARTGVPAGPLVAVLPICTPGVHIEPVATMDRQPAAVVTLRETPAIAAPAAVVTLPGAPATAYAADPAAIDRALAVHRLLRAAELAGGALAVQEMTAEHVRTRHQFGVPLSSFQAVQHLFADLATHVDAALLAAWTGLTEAARGPAADVTRAAATAPFVAGRAYLRAVTDGAQLHGGIGVSQDYPLHRYFQRAQAERLRLGALDEQLERIAGSLPHHRPDAPA